MKVDSTVRYLEEWNVIVIFELDSQTDQSNIQRMIALTNQILKDVPKAPIANLFVIR